MKVCDECLSNTSICPWSKEKNLGHLENIYGWLDCSVPTIVVRTIQALRPIENLLVFDRPCFLIFSPGGRDSHLQNIRTVTATSIGEEGTAACKYSTLTSVTIDKIIGTGN